MYCHPGCLSTCHSPCIEQNTLLWQIPPFRPSRSSARSFTTHALCYIALPCSSTVGRRFCHSPWPAFANRTRWKWWWASVGLGHQEGYNMLSSTITMRTSPAQLTGGWETHGTEPSHCSDQAKPSLDQLMASHSPGMKVGPTELPGQLPVTPRCNPYATKVLWLFVTQHYCGSRYWYISSEKPSLTSYSRMASLNVPDL